MAFSQGKSRTYQLSMAVACTLLASGGFVAAGYAGTSSADAAAMHSLNVASVEAATFPDEFPFGGAAPDGDRYNVPKMSFGDTLIHASKPAAKQVIDLTDPNGNTPHLARSVNAMRGEIPELSAELISQVRKNILAAAYQGLGHPYVWGGTSFSHGWDCSGFVQWAYAQAGVTLPRTEQWMPMVQTNNPQPGDIVVQNPDGPSHWSHIGIYLGKGLMISALNPSVGTFIHAPADVSSSSTYFTMPGFASADERAKDEASAKAKQSSSTNTPGQPSTARPATKPGATSHATPTVPTTPATTAPETSAPGTVPPTTTAPGTTSPTTTSPTTTPETTGPGTTSPTASSPGTTPAESASPAGPTTTPPITAPATVAPSVTSPAGDSASSSVTAVVASVPTGSATP